MKVVDGVPEYRGVVVSVLRNTKGSLFTFVFCLHTIYPCLSHLVAKQVLNRGDSTMVSNFD